MSDSSAPQGNCFVHHHNPATTTCASCSREICDICTRYLRARIICATCWDGAKRRRIIRNVILGVVGLGLLSASLVVAIPWYKKAQEEAASKRHASKKKKKPAPALDTKIDGYDYGSRAWKVRKLRRQLKAEPCDEGDVVRLGEVMNGANNYQGTLTMAAAYIKRCGDHKRLLWVTAYAHEHLKQYKQAAALDTVLIKHDPRDGDFWWWRAKNYQKLKQKRAAMADLMQSMANGDLSKSTGVDVIMFARLAKELRQHCAGAFALKSFKDAISGEMTQRAQDLLTELYLAGNCVKLRGQGKATIKRDQSAPVTRVQVAVNGKKGSFIIDRRSGFTLISKSFADELGLQATGPVILTYGAAKLRDAQLAPLDSLKVMGAEASRVQVAVVGTLPEGVQGVLGRSFLWRFSVSRTIDGISLKPR